MKALVTGFDPFGGDEVNPSSLAVGKHKKRIAGIAVHTGARIVALARPGEILVSSTVKDLVAGSGIEFVEHGEHELKGVPGRWQLYAASPGSS